MMTKKIKNYLKIILCYCLIFSFVVPSLAATSGDTGAFVTKEEFDKALANFNKRLSTFESGINSKIDSQVTSYLDRNGIWSGMTQILVEANRKWDYGFCCDAKYTAKYTLIPTNTYTDEKCRVDTDKSRGNIGIYANSTNKELVTKISKSGLAVVETKCTSDTTNDPRTYVASVYRPSGTAPTNLYSDHFLFNYIVKVSFIQKGKELSNINFQLNLQQGGVYLICPTLPSSVLIFFVDKNEPLYISYENTLEKDNGTVHSNTIAWVGSTVGSEYSYRTWSVEGITVY